MSSDLIARFGRTVTIVRADSAGSYVDGYWVEPATTNIPIIASVQRLNPKEVLLLKEGDRNKESFKLYSTFQFKIQLEGSLQKSDYVLIDGKKYMVIAVEDFVINQAMNIKYYKANVVLDNPSPS